MPASRFLKIVQETGQIPVQFLLASFYFPEPPCMMIYEGQPNTLNSKPKSKSLLPTP